MGALVPAVIPDTPPCGRRGWGWLGRFRGIGHSSTVGAGLCPRPVFGGRWRICRGRPACRPVGRSRKKACPGGHIGPPLHNAGNVPEITESGVENEHFPNGAGRSPPPTGATQVVRSSGPPRSSAPTESPISHPSQPARSEASAPAAARDGRESAQGPSPKGDRPRDRPGSA